MIEELKLTARMREVLLAADLEKKILRSVPLSTYRALRNRDLVLKHETKGIFRPHYTHTLSSTYNNIKLTMKGLAAVYFLLQEQQNDTGV